MFYAADYAVSCTLRSLYYTPRCFVNENAARPARRGILRNLYLHLSGVFAILNSAAEDAEKHVEEAITMAELEKLKDEALGEASGGQKYNVGNIPIPVHPYPNGPVLYVLGPGDYLVTDGQVIWRDGVPWNHVYTAFGEGCVNGNYL